VEFFLAGSAAVAIGTALFVDPSTPQHVSRGLSEYLAKMRISSVSELIGALEMPGDEPKLAPYP
jgi:dihydroorotate dehydrogenase